LSFTKVVKKRRTIQKVEGGSKIQALSSGFVHGNTARIVINDKDVLEKAGRGFNVVVLAGKNHEVISQNTYDTYANPNASKEMVEDFVAAPVGSVIVAAVMDEASNKLSADAKAIFTGMGAKEITALKFREGYLFMGIKGSKQHLEKRGNSVNAGMILGYSKVTKTTKTKHTKMVSQTRKYKRTIKRVYRERKTQTTIVNGRKVTKTKIVTRVAKRVVTCSRTRKFKKTVIKTKTETS